MKPSFHRLSLALPALMLPFPGCEVAQSITALPRRKGVKWQGAGEHSWACISTQTRHGFTNSANYMGINPCLSHGLWDTS